MCAGNSPLRAANGPAGGGFTQNVAFKIWCVDQDHYAKTSDYFAYATNLGTGDMDHTRLGQAGSNSGQWGTVSQAADIANK